MPKPKHIIDPNARLFSLPVPVSISSLADMLEQVQLEDWEQDDILERAVLEIESRCHNAETTENLAKKFIAILCDCYKDDPTWDPLSLFPGGCLPKPQPPRTKPKTRTRKRTT